MGLLTLPDLFRRKYGVLMEVIVSLIEISSFTVLLAGGCEGSARAVRIELPTHSSQGCVLEYISLRQTIGRYIAHCAHSHTLPPPIRTRQPSGHLSGAAVLFRPAQGSRYRYQRDAARAVHCQRGAV